MSKERNIQETPCNEDHCDVTAFQEIDVCVPITVEPDVDLGEPIIECIEEPYLVPIPCGAWNKKRKCRFTICQKLSIMIPIEFNIDAYSGPVSVNCSDGEEEEEEECQRPPFICCEREKASYDLCEDENFYNNCWEKAPFVCYEKNERKQQIPDFYYYVKNKRGRLKK